MLKKSFGWIFAYILSMDENDKSESKNFMSAHEGKSDSFKYYD